MAKADKEVVSILEFATRMGCNESTIRDYLKAGKIAGAGIFQREGGKPKINYPVAKSQYLEARAVSEHRFSRSIQAKAEAGNKPPAAPKSTHAPLFTPPEMVTVYSRTAPPVEMTADLAKRMGLRTTPYGPGDEVNEDYRDGSAFARKPVEPGRRKNNRAEPDSMLYELSHEQPDYVEDETDLNKMSIQDLTKREAVLRVRIKQLEIDEKTGDVVRKEDVFAALFTAGAEVRGRIEAIPDRIIDTVLAAANRTDALLILTREIKAALQNLSELDTVQLTGTRKQTKSRVAA